MALGAAAVGAVGGYAAGQSSATQTTTSTVPYVQDSALPCSNPNVTEIQGVTYYQCGSTWYTQAYGNTGVIYVPVPGLRNSCA